MSNDGMIYVTDISEVVAKKMPLNKTGLIVRVNRNRRPLIYYECRYITIKHKIDASTMIVPYYCYNVFE